MQNEFLKWMECCYLNIPYHYNYVKPDWYGCVLKDNVKEVVFSCFYRYTQFSEVGLDTFTTQLDFRSEDFTTEENMWKEIIDRDSISNKTITRFFDQRIVRDVLLAWSIRKDFYKYHLKSNMTNYDTFIKDIDFLKSVLPLEENLFFLFDDGFYICNPINESNLNKIKLHFQEENVFINNHELYFDLDENKYHPNILLKINEKKNVIPFTYFVSHIDFKKLFKDMKWRVKHINGLMDTLKEDIVNLNTVKIISEGSNTETAIDYVLETYEKYIDSEWKWIPIWYKPYMKPEMLNIEKDKDILVYEKMCELMENGRLILGPDDIVDLKK